MIQQGLEDEVLSLLPFRRLNALQTVGYKEIFARMDGAVNRQQAIADNKTKYPPLRKAPVNLVCKRQIHQMVFTS